MIARCPMAITTSEELKGRVDITSNVTQIDNKFKSISEFIIVCSTTSFADVTGSIEEY